MIVPLAELDAAALEQLAYVTLASAQTHVTEWLADLDAAREELADALAPEKEGRRPRAGGSAVNRVGGRASHALE